MEVFEIYQSGSCNLRFLKNTVVQINPKLNSKPYDYLYKNVWVFQKLLYIGYLLSPYTVTSDITLNG